MEIIEPKNSVCEIGAAEVAFARCDRFAPRYAHYNCQHELEISKSLIGLQLQVTPAQWPKLPARKRGL
jgi:hypothetical protein